MKAEEFRRWLKARRWNGKPLTSVSSRLSKARRFEKAMPDLGLAQADLDTAFEADGMEQVTGVLRDLCRTAAQTGQAPASLVGDSASAAMRINNVAAAVRNYRQFREDRESPAPAWPELEELKAAFLDRVPEFERFDRTDNGYERVERAYKDVMLAQVRDTATSRDSDEQAGRRIYRALIPNQGPLLRWQTDDDFARKFPQLAPDFYSAIGRLARDARPIVDAIMAAADTFAQLRGQGATTLTIGQVAAIAITVAGMARPRDAAPFKMTKARELAALLTGEPIFRGDVLTREQLDRWLGLLARIEQVMREDWAWHPRDLVDVQGFAWAALDEGWVVDGEDEETVIARFDGSPAFYQARQRWTAEQTQAFCTLAMAVHDAGFDWWPVNIAHSPFRFGRKSAGRKTAEGVQAYLTLRPTPRLWFNDPEIAIDFGVEHVLFDPDSAAAFSEQLTARAEDIKAWKPPLPPRPGLWPDEEDDELVAGAESVTTTPSAPTNLILHGPPGTGKTYTTAAEAVRLCDGVVPATRAAVMARYRELSDAGQVAFVTFHQSFSYEDFVEGLRPETGDAEGTGGFRLEARHGRFREIATLAEQAQMQARSGGGAFDLAGRQVFKMSLGQAGVEDHVYDAAIAGGYAVLGWGGDVDWSGPEFDGKGGWQAIYNRWRQVDSDASGYNPNVVQTWRFRTSMRPGDLVVVSEGNGRFRAVGEITGPYQYDPTGEPGFNHRRTVRWLLTLDQSLPVELIYDKRFSMQSCYLLSDQHLKREALARLLPGDAPAGPGTPDQFVLVIDEINRANISKVLGELITLLEPDKRIGMTDELRVRLPYSGDLFGVPANLHIVGTMNTADRSIALIDKALRRRFSFVEMMPEPGLLADKGPSGVDLPALLTAINDRIEWLLDREHQVGHAWLMACTTRERLDATMRERIIPLIAEYFFEDWSRVAAVLGGEKDNPFLERIALAVPPGMPVGEPRYRWRVRDVFAEDAYARATAGG